MSTYENIEIKNEMNEGVMEAWNKTTTLLSDVSENDGYTPEELENLELQFINEFLSVEKEIKEIKENFKEVKKSYKENGVNVSLIMKKCKSVGKKSRRTKTELDEEQRISDMISNSVEIFSRVCEIFGK